MLLLTVEGGAVAGEPVVPPCTLLGETFAACLAAAAVYCWMVLEPSALQKRH